MHTTQHSQEPARKPTLLAEASAQARQCSQEEIAVYLDAKLNFAPGARGETYLVNKQAPLHSGLNAFLAEAIPLDAAALRVAAPLQPSEGARIWRHLDRLDDYLCVFNDDLIDNPLRTLFFKAMSQAKFWRGPWSVFNRQATALGVDGNQKALAFTDLVGDLRHMALRANIGRKMQDWAYPVSSNILRANEYEAYLFRRCPEVSVVALSMWYQKSAISDESDAVERGISVEHQQRTDRQARLMEEDGQAPSDEQPSGIPAVPIDVVARDLRKIFDNLGNKTSISRFKIGHACSIEWSRMIGHYARLLFFFDGSQVTDPASHADLLGDYVAELTQGRITFVNGNRLPGEHPEVGLVLASDTDKRFLLRRRLLLWGQKEQFLRIRASQGFKTFRTGDIPLAWRNGV